MAVATRRSEAAAWLAALLAVPWSLGVDNHRSIDVLLKWGAETTPPPNEMNVPSRGHCH